MTNSRSKKSALYSNAIMSIKIGVEDYEMKSLPRMLSSVRNLHAGILLLAKEILVRRVDGGSSEKVIHSNYKPVLDHKGGVQYRPDSERTINLNQIFHRFQDFNMKIDKKALQSFNKLRNRIEHHSSDRPKDQILEAIAKALPIIQNLLRIAGEEPSSALGKTWEAMLKVKEVYVKELESCQETFDKFRLNNKTFREMEFVCPHCHSHLIRQKQSENIDINALKGDCQSCQTTSFAPKIVGFTLANYFVNDPNYDFLEYIRLVRCDRCEAETVIFSKGHWKCVMCKNVRSNACQRCGIRLTPSTISMISPEFCNPCADDFWSISSDFPDASVGNFQSG